MKKTLFLIAGSLISSIVYGQLGVNTTTPKSTLEIVAKESTGTSSSPEGLLIPRVDRLRAKSMTNVETSTLIYINNVATGNQTVSAKNIGAVGYYYF